MAAHVPMLVGGTLVLPNVISNWKFHESELHQQWKSF